jgi:hypothetical protein
MPLCVYFDTNVYDHIDKGYVAAEDVAALQAALRQGEITAHLSFADVEELLGQWDTDRPAAVRKLRVARELVGFDGLLKSPSDLLTEAIQAYAVGAPAPSPTLPRHGRRYLAAWLGKVAEGSTAFNSQVSGIVADVRESKKGFLSGMAEAGDQASAELGGSDAWQEAKRWAPTFDEFWAKAALEWVEAIAEHRFGLGQACRERGMNGLLQVRAVRLAVGVALSLVFSQVVEGCAPAHGDGYDMWHAVLGSAADRFVTCDQRFAGHLARIPGVDGFRVFASMRDLLTELTQEET